ncbi:MAG TPA: dipeptide ABC transporter ATP binding subunit DppF, partial [Alphaproteobacteria bacterium]|nr:dipeptide ABC transporter ATP binding subunit DppF [Alphaproteobacteria bacterium]
PSVDNPKQSGRIVLKGEMPSPLAPPPGCTFHKRCPHATDLCTKMIPELRPVNGHQVSCHHAEKFVQTSLK